MKDYNCISLFSNAGIGDIGVENAGVKILIANELLKERCDTYKKNHKETKIIFQDINKLNFNMIKTKNQINELFLMVCTPPCQGVSTAGKRDPFDIRNQLIKPTIKAILIFKPLWVWIENVPAYLKTTIPNTNNIVEDNDFFERINVIDFINKQLSTSGYTLKYKILDAKNYGVPQTRKRLIIILTRSNINISFPEITHGNDSNLIPYITVRNTIEYLESLESGEKSLTDNYHFAKIHSRKHIKWMKATPEGKTALDNINIKDRPSIIDKDTGHLRPIKAFKTTYKRIWWDKPSPTVTMCSGGISSQNNVHPVDSRALTIREVMLLQSIPNDFRFPELTTENQMREMIGEAVPPLLAEVITKHIININESQI